MRFAVITLTTLFIVAALLKLDAQESHVTLVIKKINHKEGMVLLSVYSDPSQFAYDPAIWYNIPKTCLNDDSTIVFDFDLPKPGIYALAVLDDENGSGALDRNFFGIPAEGFGFSNNFIAKGLIIPHYEDLLMKFDIGSNKVVIEIRHWKLF